MLRQMIKTHGLINGARRFSEEIVENRMFDIFNKVETSGVVTHAEFYKLVGQDPKKGAMWYQPTYTSPLVKTFRYLKKHELRKAAKTLFIDLGTGKGKPCIIASKYLKGCTLIGIDLSQELLDVCKKNLTVCGADFTLTRQNVLDTDFTHLFRGYDTVIIHNKNSFDKSITDKVLQNIEAAKNDKTVFYIYNNPIYKELFEDKELLFCLKGWHKNKMLNLYRL